MTLDSKKEASLHTTHLACSIDQAKTTSARTYEQTTAQQCSSCIHHHQHHGRGVRRATLPSCVYRVQSSSSNPNLSLELFLPVKDLCHRLPVL